MGKRAGGKGLNFPGGQKNQGRVLRGEKRKKY